MDVSYTLTEKEFGEFGSSSTLWKIVVPVVIVGALLDLLAYSSTRDASTTIAILVGLLIVGPGIKWKSRQQMKTRWRPMLDVGKPVVMRFGNDDIRRTTPSHESVISWTNVRALARRKSIYVATVGLSNAFVVPRSAVDEAAFEELFQKHGVRVILSKEK